MSTNREVAEATREYFIIEARVKREKQALGEELKEARRKLEALTEEMGQEGLFDPQRARANDRG